MDKVGEQERGKSSSSKKGDDRIGNSAPVAILTGGF